MGAITSNDTRMSFNITSPEVAAKPPKLMNNVTSSKTLTTV